MRVRLTEKKNRDAMCTPERMARLDALMASAKEFITHSASPGTTPASNSNPGADQSSEKRPGAGTT